MSDIDTDTNQPVLSPDENAVLEILRKEYCESHRPLHRLRMKAAWSKVSGEIGLSAAYARRKYHSKFRNFIDMSEWVEQWQGLRVSRSKFLAGNVSRLHTVMNTQGLNSLVAEEIKNLCLQYVADEISDRDVSAIDEDTLKHLLSYVRMAREAGAISGDGFFERVYSMLTETEEAVN